MSFESKLLEWVLYDNKIKEYNEKVKKLKEDKNNINTDLLNHIVNNSLQDNIFKFTDSKVQLQYSKSQSYNPLTYKYLHSVFISYFEQTSNNPNEEADKLLEFIKTKRTTTDKELIKRSSY